MTGAPHSSVTRYRELARKPSKNGRDRELLLDGAHLLMEARASGLAIESAAFEQTALDSAAVRTLAEQLAAGGTDVFIVSRAVLQSMSPVRSPSGVIGIARRSLAALESVLREHQSHLVVVAHDVQDPGNVGGIVRTAEAAGATAFVASAGTADPFGWKALRGSMGSALRLPIMRAAIEEVVPALRAAGIATIGLAPRGGQPLYEAQFRKPVALFLGGEGPGLPEDVRRGMDALVSIPMQPPVESLNVGVAAALVLFEAFRQRS